MQQCGVAIIKARKASSAFFAATVACDHIRDWVFETHKVDSLSPQIAFDHADLNYFPFRFSFLLLLLLLLFFNYHLLYFFLWLCHLGNMGFHGSVF